RPPALLRPRRRWLLASDRAARHRWEPAASPLGLRGGRARGRRRALGATLSTSSISTNRSPIQFSGPAPGLDPHSIIEALLAAEKVPVTRLTNQQEKLIAQQGVLSTLKTNLQSLTFSAFEFELPSLFEGVQSVTSSEPSRITA